MVRRAEHRRRTLLALGEAAVDAFETTGPSATIEDIADRAGVSRRTVFRYADAKEELVFVHPVLWLDVFDAGIAELVGTTHDTGEGAAPLAERLRAGSSAIAQHIDADPDPPRRAFLVAASHPALFRGYNAIYQRWIERVASEVLRDSEPSSSEPVSSGPSGSGPSNTGDRLRARIIGSAAMGMVDAVTREWMITPDATFTELHDRGFEQLRPLFGRPGVDDRPGPG